MAGEVADRPSSATTLVRGRGSLRLAGRALVRDAAGARRGRKTFSTLLPKERRSATLQQTVTCARRVHVLECSTDSVPSATRL